MLVMSNVFIAELREVNMCNIGIGTTRGRKYAHNFYWCRYPINEAEVAGLDAVELDIVYRLFGNDIYVSHSWRPFNFMYCGNLIEWLDDLQGESFKYIIIESKSFWIPQKLLFNIMNNFKDDNMIYVMSVQYRYPHQWLRGIWLKSFYKKYKDELCILDKRTETELNEQVDLFPKYNWFQKIIHGQF